MIHRHTGEKQHKKFYFQNGMAMIIPGQLDNLFPMKNCFLEKASEAPEKYFASSDILCVSPML